MYAAGEEHALRDPAQRVFEGVVRGSIVAAATAGVIQEFVHVFARRRGRHAAVQQARDFTAVLLPVARDDDAIPAALRLYEQYERLDAFDSLLAAVTIEGGAEALVSADRAFAGVEALPFVDLADSVELDRLLT